MKRIPKFSKDLQRMHAEVHRKVQLLDLRLWGGNMSELDFVRTVQGGLAEQATKAAEYVWPGFTLLMRHLNAVEKDLEEKREEHPKSEAEA